MEPNTLLPMKAASAVEDLASSEAEETARRHEAAGWLRQTVGVVSVKDLPEEPSEEEFRLGLRNGLILCHALNKVHPGAVPVIVVNQGDPVPHPDGPVLSAIQYFENVGNFLVAAQDLGIPTFEGSDLEQGGRGARVVNCVLAMKSYSEWKKAGGIGSWRYDGIVEPSNLDKSFPRKNSEQSTDSLSISSSKNAVPIMESADTYSTANNVTTKEKTLRQHSILEQHGNNIKELKQTLRTTKAAFEFMQKKYTEDLSMLGLRIYRFAKVASGEVRDLKEQIARLKSELEIEMGGSGHTQSMIPDPKVFDTREPLRLILEGRCDVDLLERQSMEDVRNLDLRSTPPFRQKKLSLDDPDLPRTTSESILELEENEISSAEWINKLRSTPPFRWKKLNFDTSDILRISCEWPDSNPRLELDDKEISSDRDRQGRGQQCHSGRQKGKLDEDTNK